MNKRPRRPNLNFLDMRIPGGATLVSVITGEEAKVMTERTVEFRNQIMYLTEATKLTYGKYANPCPHWTYKGQSLRDIYNKTF